MTGEPPFLRDRGFLESALARPHNAFVYGEEDVVALAVKLMAGLLRAHAFEQGNKRTAFVAMVQFLNMNGCDPAIEDSLPWAEAVTSLVEHRSTEADFAYALRPFVIARS